MITLQPITIKFEHTEEFDIEAYLEWCEQCSIEPSQKHYKEWATDCLVDSLMDDIDTDEFQFIYGDSQEINYKEENWEPFDYSSYVEDLTEEELKEFHALCDADKIILSPAFCKDNIITMNSLDNPTISYGIIVDKNGDILTIKKSINHHHMFSYLKQNKDTF
jgi:hypothetical protein